MRRALRLAALALLALPAAPATAQTGTILSGTAGRIVGGPVLSGDEVLWAEATDELGTRLLSAHVAERRPRVLLTVPPVAGAESVSVSLQASPSSLLFWALYERCDGCKAVPQPVGVRAFAGPAGALRPVTGDGADVPYNTPSLAGDRLAFRGHVDRAPLIRFLDPATRETVDVPSREVDPYDVEGDLVVHRAPGEEGFAVREWRTGRVVYRPELPEDWPPYALTIRLAADGTTLWTGSPPGRTESGIASPDAPAVRLLPVGEAFPHAMAGGRLLLGSYPSGAWSVHDLEGRELARLPHAVTALDGRRVAWGGGTCAVPVVRVWEFERDPYPASALPACRGVRVTARPRIEGRRLLVTVGCAADAPSGCVADVGADLYRRRRLLDTASERVALSAGERRTLALRTRRRTLRRRPLRAVVIAEPTPGAPPGERHVARFRLRR